MRYLFILGLVLIPALTSQPVFANGGENGNGGDGIAISFFGFASTLTEYFSAQSDPTDFSAKKLDQYSDILRTLVIDTTDDELRDKNNQVKDALNFAGVPPRVLINRKRWGQLAEDGQRKLAFHEILCLMNLESSDDYHLSSKLGGDSRAPHDDSILSLDSDVPVIFIDGGLLIEEYINGEDDRTFDETHTTMRVPLRKNCDKKGCSYQGGFFGGRMLPMDYILTRIDISTADTNSLLLQISANIETASQLTSLGSFDLNLAPEHADTFAGISADDGQALEGEDIKNKFYIKFKMNRIRFGTENSLEAAYDQFQFALQDLAAKNSDLAVRKNLIVAAQKLTATLNSTAKTLKGQQLANLDDFTHDLLSYFNLLHHQGFGLEGSTEVDFFTGSQTLHGSAEQIQVSSEVVNDLKKIAASQRDPKLEHSFSDNSVANNLMELSCMETSNSSNIRISKYDFFEKCIFDQGDHDLNVTLCN